MYYNLL